MPEPCKNISIRLRPATIVEIDAIAEAEQRTRGDMIRLLLADGLKSYKRRRGMA
jgi:predicted transcriptional regulator